MLERDRFLARPGRGRLPSGRRAVPLRARRHQLREPAGDARVPQATARAHRFEISKIACCWPKPISGPKTPSPILDRGDECHMAFHFPLMPRLFMSLRMEDRFPDRRNSAADAAIPPSLPMGPVPAQSRRTHARNGHRRRARLHVSRVRAGPPHAHQPGHPPAPGAAARKRPPQDRTDERAAVLPARHAGDLLRRRNRHGRQHLPRRPQRRPHAHAMERGPQRRLFPRQSAEALSARSPSIPNTITKRSTWRRSRTIRIRCCGG